MLGIVVADGTEVVSMVEVVLSLAEVEVAAYVVVVLADVDMTTLPPPNTNAADRGVGCVLGRALIWSEHIWYATPASMMTVNDLFTIPDVSFLDELTLAIVCCTYAEKEGTTNTFRSSLSHSEVGSRLVRT